MSDSYFESLVRDLQPGLLSRFEDLELFLREFLRSVLRQPTHEKAGLGVDREGETAVIEGYLPHPAACRALVRILEMTALPSLQAGFSHASDVEESTWFLRSNCRVRGLIGPFPEADCAHIWEEGDPIRVLRNDRGFVLCQATDGYQAWANPDEVGKALHRAEPFTLPEKTESPHPRVNDLKAGWLGAPYVWGGTGFEGVDCSGLTLRMYQSIGVQLPRDSHQQMLGGALVATHDHPSPMREGDLLFFTHEDGRIGHVAISLGGMRVLHAQEGGVCEFSLDPGEPDYDAYRAENFVFAKRWIGCCP